MPPSPKPHGTLIAGMPVMLARKVLRPSTSSRVSWSSVHHALDGDALGVDARSDGGRGGRDDDVAVLHRVGEALLHEALEVARP